VVFLTLAYFVIEHFVPEEEKAFGQMIVFVVFVGLPGLVRRRKERPA
jgi:hypothetical protein